MSELTVLRVLLLASMAVAPLGTHGAFFARRGRGLAVAWSGGLACAAGGLFSPWPLLCVGWLAFCAGSFAVFLASRARAEGALRSREVVAASVPFTFSVIAAVWLVAGANDLKLLGYGPQFSFYAALHATVLGWVVLGALAILACRGGAEGRVHQAVVLVCLGSFLLVALGIDQLHALKPLGVVGLSVALPTSQLTFLRGAWGRSRAAFALGAVSLAGLAFTMALAWGNHLGAAALPAVAGLRGMVAVHGALNALVVGPALLVAVVLDGRAGRAVAGADPSSLTPLQATSAQ